jgi:hypothetical protein
MKKGKKAFLNKGKGRKTPRTSCGDIFTGREKDAATVRKILEKCLGGDIAMPV